MTIKVTTLNNGLRIVSDLMDSVETVSVGAWVAVGTRHERADINGISHLLEHMAFKGTERRSALAIAEEIEAVGGHLNAYTSRENTAYFAKVLKEDLALAVDIVADIVLNATLDADELERERAVILQEIHQSRDTPDDIIFDKFQETAFPDQPLGRPVLGTAERIETVARDNVADYLQRQYYAPRMVVSAAGNLAHAPLVELAEAAFATVIPQGDDEAQPAAYRGGDFREVRDLEQVQLILGFEGIAFDDADYYPLAVLSTLLGGGMSSRLFQEVREKRGLAYSIYSFVANYADGGLFGIHAGTGEAEVEELVPVVCEELARAREPASEQELSRARTQFKSGTLMSRESTGSRTEQAARQLQIYGRTVPVAEVVAKIDAVEAADVARIARRLFESPLTAAALGPVGKLEEYDRIAGRLR